MAQSTNLFCAAVQSQSGCPADDKEEKLNKVFGLLSSKSFQLIKNQISLTGGRDRMKWNQIVWLPAGLILQAQHLHPFRN